MELPNPMKKLPSEMYKEEICKKRALYPWKGAEAEVIEYKWQVGKGGDNRYVLLCNVQSMRASRDRV